MPAPLTIPPGGRAKAHRHESHESAIYTVSGRCEFWWGEGLAHRDEVGPGDFVYIPAGVPHLPINRRDEPVSASSPAPTRTSRRAWC